MKRFTQIMCLILIFTMVLVIPVFAAEQASHYFGSHSCYLWEISDTEFQVWFNVTAVSGMDVLGASEIVIQYSSDRSNWDDVQTSNNILGYNTGYWSGHVTYSSAAPGYYRAMVTFYAENDNGIGEYVDYTSSIQLP